MPRRLKAPDRESFCDSSRLRAINLLLASTRMKRPVTHTDTTPSNRAPLPEGALSIAWWLGAPWSRVMMPECTVIAAKNDIAAANKRIALGLGKVSDLRKSRSEEHTSELQSLRHLVCRL